MAEFIQIKNGMTYEQVTEIIGAPSDMVAETGTPSDQFYTVTYNFKGGILAEQLLCSVNFSKWQAKYKGSKGTIKTNKILNKKTMPRNQFTVILPILTVQYLFHPFSQPKQIKRLNSDKEYKLAYL